MVAKQCKIIMFQIQVETEALVPGSNPAQGAIFTNYVKK